MKVELTDRAAELAVPVATRVTGRGRLGNGDEKLLLTSFDELPCMIGLVQQTLERLLGTSD